MADAADIGLLQWAFGLGATAVSVALGHLHFRINDMQTRTDALRREERDEAAKESDRLWRAVDDLRARMLTVVTKDDLREVERRLTDAIAKIPPRT